MHIIGMINNICHMIDMSFWHVILCILSQYVQNYRPTHGQTNILLDQLQKHFFSHITCTGGGGSTIESICLI